MKKESSLQDYFSAVVRLGLYSSERRLEFHLRNLFRGIEFENKRMLDIGGGTGIWSYYAASMGAQEVVCLEPEIEGSSSGSTDNFRKLQANLSYDQVQLEPTTIQSFVRNNVDRKFDIILLNNSVNHLDENACITLLEDDGSQNIYRQIFKKINTLTEEKATLIVCDCSRHNFYSLLRIKNPFAPNIEWNKHQSPKIWAELFREVGFCDPRIRWTTFNRLGSFGKLLLDNRFASFFLTSQFCLYMRQGP